MGRILTPAAGLGLSKLEQQTPAVMPLRPRWPNGGPPLGEPFRINRDSPQSHGLVFWLPMLGHEAGSMQFVDKVGGRQLTPYNGPIWTPDGWIGNALLLDDVSSQYLEVPFASVTGAPLTMACWYNSDDDTVWQEPFSIGDVTTTNSMFTLKLRGNFNDYVRFKSYENPINGIATATTPYVANVWGHICGVEYSSSSRAVFHDGGNKGTDTTTVVPSVVNSLHVGQRTMSIPGYYMSGMVADARIYNRALSDAEVAQLFDPKTRWELYEPERRIWSGWAAPTIITEPRALVKRSWDLARPPLEVQFDVNWESPQADGLVFWLPMMGQEAGANQFIDKVGGLALTPYNGPIWTPDGWIGNALLFDDASSQYLRVESAVVTAYPFTMACWFYVDTADEDNALMWIGDKDDGLQMWSLRAAGLAVGDPLQLFTQAGGPPEKIESTGGFAVDTWHHACGVCTNSTSRTVYLDRGYSATGVTALSPSGVNRTSIGCFDDVSPSDYYGGMIADVRIYNRAFSDAEVAQLYDPATRWDLFKVTIKNWMGYDDIVAVGLDALNIAIMASDSAYDIAKPIIVG